MSDFRQGRVVRDIDSGHRRGGDGTEHLCTFDCEGTVHPGAGRGYPATRAAMVGKTFKVRPNQHVGHTVTISTPYGVSITPSYQPTLRHRVTCSCGDEWDMTDEALAMALQQRGVVL